jgi:hypothetical protein
MEFTSPHGTAASAAGSEAAHRGLVDAVIGSDVYTAQTRLAGRAAPSAEQVRAVLLALLAAPERRINMSQLSDSADGPARARGAFAMLQRVLNVDGYPVLGLDVDGVTAVLDENLLREQFGVPADLS